MSQINITKTSIAPPLVEPKVGNPSLPANIANCNANKNRKIETFQAGLAALEHKCRRASNAAFSLRSAGSSSTYVSFDHILSPVHSRYHRPPMDWDLSTLSTSSRHSRALDKFQDEARELGIEVPHFQKCFQHNKSFVLEEVLMITHVAAEAELIQASKGAVDVYNKLRKMSVATKVNPTNRVSPPTDLKECLCLFGWFRRTPIPQKVNTAASRSRISSVRSTTPNRSAKIASTAPYAPLHGSMPNLGPGTLTQTATPNTLATITTVKTNKTSKSNKTKWLLSNARRLKLLICKPSKRLPQTLAFMRSRTTACPRTRFPFSVPPIKNWNPVKAYRSFRYGIESQFKVLGIEDENWRKVSYMK